MQVYERLMMASDLLFVLGGATMFWLSPKLRRNWILGYGSARSMVNDATWQAANRFAGSLLAMFAVILMSLQIVIWPLLQDDDKRQALFVGLLFSLPFLVMYLTERRLSRVFRI